MASDGLADSGELHQCRLSDPAADPEALARTGLLANGEKPYAPDGKALIFLNRNNQAVVLSESFARAMARAYPGRNVFLDFSGIAGWLSCHPWFRRPEAIPGAMELYVNNCINFWNRKDNLPRHGLSWREILASEQGLAPKAGGGEESPPEKDGREEKRKARQRYLNKARADNEWHARQYGIGGIVQKFMENLEAGKGGKYGEQAH